MSVAHPTAARIEAAKLLKKLNDADNLPTEPDVLALAALDADEFETPPQQPSTLYADAAALPGLHLVSDSRRVAFFGPHVTGYELEIAVPPDPEEPSLFGPRRSIDA